jgi:hypothetical protein
MIIARMFSPILIAPGLAAVLAMAMVLTPRFSWLGTSASVAGFMIGAVLLRGSSSGSASSRRRCRSTRPALALDPALDGAEDPTILVAVLYTIALIAGACIMGDTMRTRTRTAIRHLQIQAWQLRQLVPHH